MNKRAALSLAAGVSLLCTTQVPASVKPCRDKTGKVIQCPKIRKPSPRCKDANGKFVACASTRTSGDDELRPIRQ